MDKDLPALLSIPDRVTGEVLAFREVSPGVYDAVIDPLVFAARRWRYKYVVRSLLGYTSRQSKCHRWRIPGEALNICRSLEHGQTFYGGLEVCGSVWLCPLCAAKISERRRSELDTAIANARAQGLWVQLLTLTFPHGMGDDLGVILDGLTKAWSKYMWAGRKGSHLKDILNFTGHIRCLEVTYGSNGWHPHLHVLIFSRNKLPMSMQEQIWVSAWCAACVKAGLPEPSMEHGCSLQNGDMASNYVSKWGLAQEMTKSHLKHGKKKGLTPWDLLRVCAGETWDDMPNLSKSTCQKLWLTYAKHFKGRRQLFWSWKLKDLLNVRVMTDDEAATEDIDSALVLASLTDVEWSWVLAARAEVDLLSVARDCPDAIHDFIKSLAPDIDLPFTLDSYDEELDFLFGSTPGSSAHLPY